MLHVSVGKAQTRSSSDHLPTYPKGNVLTERPARYKLTLLEAASLAMGFLLDILSNQCSEGGGTYAPRP